MLLTQAAAAVERLRNAEAARAGLAEAETLDKLLKEFSGAVRPLLAICETMRMLRSEGVSISTPAEIQRSLQTIINAAARFREKPESTALKQGKRWASMLDAVSLLKKTCEASLNSDWTTYFGSHLFSGPPPEEIRRILAQTPSNTALLRRYTELFHKFASARAAIPTTPEALARLREHSLQLCGMRFETDVPDDVRAFFEAVATPFGATLNHLTDSVIAWLKNNGHFDTYVVRARVI